MGGRGSSGIAKGSSDGAFMSKKLTKVETIYRESRLGKPGYYGDEILEATTDGNGNLTFKYAKGGDFSKTAKTNRTNYVEYEIQSGAKNGQTFNIDWSKVNSISGQTYSLRDEAKKAGLKWDPNRKRWARP